MSKTLTDKQRKMVAAAESIAKDSSRMEEIIRQKKLEQQRRKDVFHAIEKLINPVDNEELRTQLPLIDSNSWLEVVEERYISKLCGFPTCSGSVDKNAKTQMYRIDRKSKKVYVACTDRQKYCSEICFERSIGIRAQLADQPFWLTGSRHEKQYDLSLQKKEKPVLVVEDIFVDETPLITKFGELTVAESAETDEEDEDAENSQTDDTDGLAKSLSTFLSMKPSSSVTSAPLATAGSSQESSLKPVKQVKPEDALARLRSKYGRDGKQNLRRPPIIIDAKPIEVDRHKKCSEVDAKPIEVDRHKKCSEVDAMDSESA
ncbi:hypothetical protein QR680_017765 [Steinernema hermaphroditum]|uniref:RNA polymerase II subunit B1 CTD phosphatase RPAP2 homolog n=1 Tax=Steinernema hermaphroditum TaxID=289476 RepID=A0AA39HFQ3_9BILA|nr:hypothetical protein QR680_017765 [Steinernema hermaphroditum]